MKTILSLFDHSGNWSAPFWDAGHEVFQADIKNEEMPVDIAALDCRTYFEDYALEDVDGILAAPPCTNFTNSAAWVWKKQDAAGETAAAVHLARQVLRSVDLWKPDFWALENPIGRLPALVPELGKPRLMFDPWEYAGWVATPADIARLDVLRGYFDAGIPFAPEDLALIKRVGAYTKRTAIWGEFNLPEKKPIAPVKVCAQGSWLQKLGGKSEKTKAARSETPMGFAMAFYAANAWTPSQVEGWALKRAIAWAADLYDAGDPAALEEIEAEFGPVNGFVEKWAAMKKPADELSLFPS